MFRLGFLARKNSYELGVPAVPLGELYRAEVWQKIGGASIQTSTPVERIVIEDGAVRAVATASGELQADYYVCALPFERVPAVAPDLALDSWRDSSIRPSPGFICGSTAR